MKVLCVFSVYVHSVTSTEENQKLAETNAGGVWHTLFLTDLQHMRHLCSSCNVPLASLDTTARLTLLAEETAELERRNEELAKDNAVLDTENEKYWGMYSTSPAHGG